MTSRGLIGTPAKEHTMDEYQERDHPRDNPTLVGCGGSGSCAIGIADKFCPNCPVPNEATMLGWDQRGYEWTDSQGAHWKCIDAQWCWYYPKSGCWQRAADGLMEAIGPFTRRTTMTNPESRHD